MLKRISTSTVAALALFTFVGLVAALAPSLASQNLARAHSPGGAALTALTVTAGGRRRGSSQRSIARIISTRSTWITA